MTEPRADSPRFVVVGIGADGWSGLTGAAQRELHSAAKVFGSARQLDLLGTEVDGELTPWRSPMSGHLREVLVDNHDGPVHLLASGDPMFHGLGTTVVDAVGAANVRVLPHPSSVSLAAARLGWDLSTIRVVSLVTGEVEDLLGEVGADQRLVVLSRDAASPAAVAEVLRANGFGDSTMTVLEQLGGPAERVFSGVAGAWGWAPGDALNVVAVECAGPTRVRTPGLPDADFAHDGQLTKQAIRALTVAALAPADRQVLWDVGAGSGSVGIEWLRVNPTGTVVAFERHPERIDRIWDNARRHGVAARLTAVDGDIADTIAAQAAVPDAIFAGGGLTGDRFTQLWSALRSGGVFVANAVAIPTQQLLVDLHGAHGGTLRRISVEEAGPLGTVTAWRPARPIVEWVVRK